MIPAHIEHTFKAIDRILNGSSKRAAATADKSHVIDARPEGSSPCDGASAASAVYPVTCRARYYDAASRILEEEGQLFTHDNANELGALIQQWISDARDNWEPR